MTPCLAIFDGSPTTATNQTLYTFTAHTFTDKIPASLFLSFFPIAKHDRSQGSQLLTLNVSYIYFSFEVTFHLIIRASIRSCTRDF